MLATGESARAAFYRERFPDFWYDVGNEPYALLDAFAMDDAGVARIRRAAGDAWRIMARIAPVMRGLPDAELRSIGIPPAALRACRRYDASLGETLIARFDLALTDDGPKILELNAETPMFLWESFEISGIVARRFGLSDPNTGAASALTAAIARAAGSGRLAVTAYNTWREDWFSAVFAARIATAALGQRVDVIPLHELRLHGGALRDGDDVPIEVLWRLYPLEHIAADRDGPKLLELVEREALRLINPASALLLQNKAALAVVWELAGHDVWFDANERAVIEKLFLPTYLDQPSDDAIYVRKPVLGREGNSVAIVQRDCTLAATAARHYAAQPAVYQRYVTLPRTHGGHAVVTCFVIDGEPGPVGLRIGDAITDGHARFLPVGVR